MNRVGNTTWVRRWSGRIVILVALLAGIIILLGVSGYLSLHSPWLETRSINLTGKNASGQIEVPVLNLWAQPGFGSDNQIEARVSLLPTGEVKARLLARQEVQGLSWYKVNPSTPQPEGWGLLRVDPERRFCTPPSKAGLNAVERVKVKEETGWVFARFVVE